MTDDAAPREYAFDAVGRLVHRDIGGRVTTWTYNDGEWTSIVTLPNGDSIATQHDAEGRIVGLGHAVIGDVEMTRDPVGRPVTLEASGLRRSWDYRQGLLVGYPEEVNGSSSHYVLDLDDAGNVVSESNGDLLRTYRYDAAGQLVGMHEGQTTWEWMYDTCGRLTEEHSPTGDRHFTYNATSELVEVTGIQAPPDTAMTPWVTA